MSHIVDAHYWRTIADLNRDKAKLLERIKRLEEAGDRLAGTTPPSSDRYKAWIKAKEAKP